LIKTFNHTNPFSFYDRNIKRSEIAQFQGLFDKITGVDTIERVANNGLESLNSGIETLKGSNELFSTFISSLAPALEQITSTFKSLNTGFQTSTLIGLVALLYSLWRMRKDKIAMLSILCSHGLIHMGTPLFMFFKEHLEKIHRRVGKFQNFSEDAGSFLNSHYDKILKYFPIMSTVSLIFLAPFLKSGPLDAVSYMKAMTTVAIEKAGTIGRATTGIQSFYTVMSSLVETALNSILYHCCGVTRDTLENQFNTSVKQLLTDVEAISDYHEQHAALLDNRILDKLQVIMSRAFDMCKTYDNLKNTPSWEILRVILDRTKQLHAKLVDVCSAKDKERTAPVAILIQGQSGIGKSFLTDYIVKFLAKYHNKLVSDNIFEGPMYDLDDLGQLKYPFNAANEYYDGYKQQFAIVMDDFGQRRDTESNPNPELNEIIQIVNEAQYVVHSAHLADKGKIYMKSNFVLASSNTLKHDIKSITYPLAMYRRFAFVAQFKVKPQYAATNGSLDVSKVKGIQTDLYDISLVNPTSLIANTGVRYVRENISMREFLYIICEKYKEQFSKTKIYQDFMQEDNNFDINFAEFQSLDDDDIDAFSKYYDIDQQPDLISCDFSYRDILSEFKNNVIRDLKNVWEKLTSINFSFSNMREHFTYFNIKSKFAWCSNVIVQNWKLIVGACIAALGVCFFFFSKKKNSCKTCEVFDKSCKTPANAAIYIEHMYKNKKCAKCISCRNFDRSTPYDELVRAVELARITPVPHEYLRDEQSYTAMDKFVKSMFNISLSRDSDKINGRLTMLKGRVALVNNHVATLLQNRDEFYIAGFGSEKQKIIVSNCRFVYPKCTSDDFNDYALIALPTSMDAFPNLHKHICTAAEMRHFTNVRVNLLNFEKNKQVIRNGEAVASDAPIACEGNREIRQAYEYQIPTIPGDCGSLLIAENKMLAHKIIGIHSLGTPNFNASTCLTYERISRLLEEIPAEFQISVPEMEMIRETNGELLHQDAPISNVRNMGELLRIVATPTKSNISPSPLHGKIEDCKPTCKPARMFNPSNDPMTMGLKKVANLPDPVDSELLKKCSNHFFSGPKICGNSQARILTYEEGVSGCKELGVVPLNRTTSPGYPYTLDNPGKGKQHWFGSSDYKYSEEIRSKVNERITKAKLGERTETIWIDTLKDERRPIEKVNANKTRVFSVGPQDYIIAVRMYFGAFVGHIMKNRIDNEICVGINCYTDEWTKLAMRLREGGPKVIAGDFSNFDGSLLIDILREICEKINEWYDDNHKLIRTVLFEEICNGIHSCRGHVYRWTHSQPSGNPLTVIINSIFNSIVMRMAFVKTGRTLIAYDKYVRMANFGDDNLFSVHENCIDDFNQITITEALADMGLTYTDEGKTGELVAYRTLDNVAFLKRGFRRVEGGRYRAPLALATITEMCQWLRSTADPKEDCKQNVENALFELSLHDQQTWDIYAPKILKACRKNGIHIGHYDKLDYYNERIREFVENEGDCEEVEAIFQCLYDKPQELLAKNTYKREPIVCISRQEAIHQDKEIYLDRQALRGTSNVSGSSSGSVTALTTTKLNSVNKQSNNNNGKFSLLTQGTKVQTYYDNEKETLFVKTLVGRDFVTLSKKCAYNDIDRNINILRIKAARANKSQAYKPSRSRPATNMSGDAETRKILTKVLEANISGDDKTQRILNRVLESNISGDDKTKKMLKNILESNISGDDKTSVRLNKVLESLEERPVSMYSSLWKMFRTGFKIQVSSLSANYLWNIYAGFTYSFLPEIVEFEGKYVRRDVLRYKMQTKEIEPWSCHFEKYLTCTQRSMMNYSFYILTSIMEESMFDWDEKLKFGIHEFLSNVRTHSVTESFPALCCHFITYLSGFVGYGFMTRVFLHAIFNILIVWKNSGVCATMLDQPTDNAAIMGTEIGEVSDTNMDADMTQVTQDQTKVVDVVTNSDNITTERNSLAQTLQRKILIRKFELPTIVPQLTAFIADEFPNAMFEKSKFLTARMQNYRYIRGSIKFTFMVNATKFDIGQIYLTWTPNGRIDPSGTFDDYHYHSIKTVTSCIGIPVKVGPGVVGELTVPCLLPYKGYDVHANIHSYGVLRAFIINPIKAASTDSIKCTYYAEFCPDVQVEVAMPADSGSRYQQATLMESVSSALTVVKNITSVVPEGIPIVSEIAGTVNKVLGLFGWSKSNNIEDVHQICQLPSKEINHSRGLDNSIVLGLDSKDCSDITDAYCYRKPYDEMSFQYLYKQRCLVDTLEWTSTGLYTIEGDFIPHKVIQVKPLDMTIESPLNKDLDICYVDYLGFIGNTFDLWTGEIEYHIEILNHMAQSGRIRVGIFPPISTNYAMTLADEEFDNVPNMILDIQANQSSVTFNAPFLLPTAWANAKTPGCTIVIASLNDLVYQSGTPDSAYVNIWRRGTKTLQFSSPRLQTDFVPQWRASKDISPETSLAKFQYYVENDEAQSFQTFETSRCVADANVDAFKSVKDLINRAGSVGSNLTNKLNVWKWNTNLFGSLDDTYSSDDQVKWNSQRPTMLEYYSRLYAFVRGSLNFKTVPFNSTTSPVPGLVYTSVNNDTSTVADDSFFTGLSDELPIDIVPRMIEFTAVHPLAINPVAEVNVPQFSQLPMRTVQYVGRQDNEIPLTEDMQYSYENRALQIIYNGNSRYDMMMGGGDDLQFSAPYGVPALARVK